MRSESFWSLLIVAATFWLLWFLVTGLYGVAESRWQEDLATRVEPRENFPRSIYMSEPCKQYQHYGPEWACKE